MIRARRYIKEEGLTQVEAAERFGVKQPEISNLINRKVDKFSIDKLVNMLARVGICVEVETHTIDEKVDEMVPA